MSSEVSPVVIRLAEAVADARGESPDALDPLGFSFDVEAVGRFLERASEPARIAIELEDCMVVVDETGTVAVSTNTSP